MIKLLLSFIVGVNLTLLPGEKVSLREMVSKLKFSVRTTDKFSIILETPYTDVLWSSLYPKLVATRSGKVFSMSEPPVRTDKGDVLFPREFLDFLFSQGETREIRLVKPSERVSYKKESVRSAVDKANGENVFSKVERNASEKRVGVAPIRTVIIDPGHGGKDPGAIGWKKRKEKDLVLAIAKRVAEKLRRKLAKYGVRVVLTRNADRFISLEGRVKKANSFLSKDSQAIFVSIHANASISRKKSGVETYYLSERATGEDARAVAVAENAVFEKEVKSGKIDELGKVIGSLLQEELQKESKIMARFIQNRIAEKTKSHLKNRGVKGAMFYVLKWVAMPSVLVETGFITNPGDSNYLVSDKGQEALAEGISEGVVEFFNLYKKTSGFTK